jgi:hypothetical protein
MWIDGENSYPFAAVHGWALTHGILDSQPGKVDDILREAMDDLHRWVLMQGTMDDLQEDFIARVIDALDGLTADQRRGRALVSLVSYITSKKSSPTGWESSPSKGKGNVYGSLLGRTE